MGSDNDREEENEHGGDIQEQPHDPDTDLEYSLGWHNPTFGDPDPMPGWSGIDGFDGFDQGNGLIFDGDGHHRVFHFDTDGLLGIHKCLGPVPAGHKTYMISDEEVLIQSEERRRRQRQVEPS